MIHHFDQHMLLIAATRYFLGRMTAATGSFAESLAIAWPDIPENTRRVIREDIERAFTADDNARAKGDTTFLPLGMDCDRAGWEKVREAWQKPVPIARYMAQKPAPIEAQNVSTPPCRHVGNPSFRVSDNPTPEPATPPAEQPTEQIENRKPAPLPEPFVSDHAVIRYLERKFKFNVEEIRGQILTPKRIAAIKAGAHRIKDDGMIFVIKGNAVATVLTNAQEKARKRPMRTGKQENGKRVLQDAMRDWRADE